MSAGRFADAVSALRGSAEGAPVDAERTRMRILSDLRRQRARRAVMLRVVVPLAAVFACSTAWAAAAGYLPASWQAVVTVLGFDDHTHAPVPAPHSPAVAPVAPPPAGPAAGPAPSAPVSVALPLSTPPGASPVPAPLSARQQGASPAPAPLSARQQGASPAPVPLSEREAASPAPPAPAASVASDGDSLYTEAHRLHFAQYNPAAALSAWDAYLRAAPRGRFAVEAHYNRALCLVRLGKTSQAKSALQPFADGAFGGYRQAEARGLLDAMAGAER